MTSSASHDGVPPVLVSHWAWESWPVLGVIGSWTSQGIQGVPFTSPTMQSLGTPVKTGSEIHARSTDNISRHTEPGLLFCTGHTAVAIMLPVPEAWGGGGGALGPVKRRQFFAFLENPEGRKSLKSPEQSLSASPLPPSPVVHTPSPTPSSVTCASAAGLPRGSPAPSACGLPTCCPPDGQAAPWFLVPGSSPCGFGKENHR